MPANFVSEWIELTNWDGVGTVLVLIKCYQCPFNSVAVNSNRTQGLKPVQMQVIKGREVLQLRGEEPTGLDMCECGVDGYAWTYCNCT